VSGGSEDKARFSELMEAFAARFGACARRMPSTDVTGIKAATVAVRLGRIRKQLAPIEAIP
jgi:hypothetical protein